MKSKKWKLWSLAAVVAAGAIGCSSNRRPQAHASAEPPFTDTAEHNRLLVHAALAQNVANGVAAERTVYAFDFDPGHAELNELGQRRVQTLIDAMRKGTGPVVVLQGDAPDALYSERLASVRQQLSDAGLNLKDVVVLRGSVVGGPTSSSKVESLAYEKMLTTYQQKQTTSQNNAMLTLQPAGQPSSNKD